MDVYTGTELESASSDTRLRIEALMDAVRAWTSTINLVSKASVAQLWERHVLDSAQIYALAPDAFAHWVDLGSGGGFPGLIVAIVGKERNASAKFTLVEADQRKAVFLREMIRKLSLNAMVCTDRIESAIPLNGDVVSARALAPLNVLLAHAQRHGTPGGVALFLKGKSYKQELAVARESHHFESSIIPNQIDKDAAVLKIWGIRCG